MAPASHRKCWQKPKAFTINPISDLLTPHRGRRDEVAHRISKLVKHDEYQDSDSTTTGKKRGEGLTTAALRVVGSGSSGTGSGAKMVVAMPMTMQEAR